MNIFTLFNRIASRCSVKAPEAFSQIDQSPKYTLIKTCFEDTVNDMLQRRDWPQLERANHLTQNEFISNYDSNDQPTSDPNQAIYTRMRFPSDYLRPVKNKGVLYNKNDYLIGIPITNQVDWAITADFGFNYPEKFRFNPTENYIDIVPVLTFENNTPSEDLALYYISKNYLKNSKNVYSSVFPTDSDWEVLLDDETIYFGTVGRYYMHQQWQDSSYMSNYELKMQEKYLNAKPHRSISIGGRNLRYRRPTYFPLSKLRFN